MGASVISLSKATGTAPYQELWVHVAEEVIENLTQGEDKKGVSYNTLYNFLTFHCTPTEGEFLDMIVLGLERLLARSHFKNSKHLEPAFRNAKFFEAFNAYRYGETASPDVHDAPPAIDFPIEIKTSEYAEAAAMLCGCDAPVTDAQADILSAHYSSFRYSTKVGHIVRSAITFRPPTLTDPVCRFTNELAQSNGSRRFVKGIAFIQGGTLYAIGQISGAPGLKFMALPTAGERRPKIMSGLTLSKMHGPIIGRVALCREKDNTTKGRVYTRPELSEPHLTEPHFVQNIRPLIQNDCAFSIREQVLYAENLGDEPEVINQSDMVTYVNAKLKGHFFLQFEDAPSTRVPFNPAAHEHYTFNSAVTLPT